MQLKNKYVKNFDTQILVDCNTRVLLCLGSEGSETAEAAVSQTPLSTDRTRLSGGTKNRCYNVLVIPLCQDKLSHPGFMPIFTIPLKSDESHMPSGVWHFQEHVCALLRFLDGETLPGEHGIIQGTNDEGGNPDMFQIWPGAGFLPIIFSAFESVEGSCITIIILFKGPDFIKSPEFTIPGECPG